MKRWKYIVPLLILFSCSEDETKPIVQLINKIEVFDVGNDGKSSDIRVRFGVESIAEITEMRIVIIPEEELSNFSKKQALSLDPDSYHTIEISTTDDKYSERLGNIKDVTGNTISYSKDYIIKILLVGDNFNQLSIESSNKLRLQEIGVYTGTWLGTGCCLVSEHSEFTYLYEVVGVNASYEARYRFPNQDITDVIRITIEENDTAMLELDCLNCTGGHSLALHYRDCDGTTSATAVIRGDLVIEATFPRCSDLKAELQLVKQVSD